MELLRLSITSRCEPRQPMCQIDQCDPCAFFTTVTPKARRTHRCAECGRTIEPGEIYHRTSYGRDGSVETNKACSHCGAAREWLNKHCGGWVTEALNEDLHEHWNEGYRVDSLGRLLVGMRNKWQWVRRAGLRPIPAIPKTA